MRKMQAGVHRKESHSRIQVSLGNGWGHLKFGRSCWWPYSGLQIFRSSGQKLRYKVEHNEHAGLDLGECQVDIDHVGEEENLMQNDGSDISERHITCTFTVDSLLQAFYVFDLCKYAEKPGSTGQTERCFVVMLASRVSVRGPAS